MQAGRGRFGRDRRRRSGSRGGRADHDRGRTRRDDEPHACFSAGARYALSAPSRVKPAASTSASAPAPAGELGRRGQAVLRGAARQRQRRPAERVERKREDGEGSPRTSGSIDVGRRRDEPQGRRQQQVAAVERRLCALGVLPPRSLGRRVLAVGDLEAALDLAGDVLAVEVAVSRVELAVDVADLAHERRARPPRPSGSRSRRGVGRAAPPPRAARGRAGRSGRATRRRPSRPRASRAPRPRSPGPAPAAARRSPRRRAPWARRGRSSGRAGTRRRSARARRTA